MDRPHLAMALAVVWVWSVGQPSVVRACTVCSLGDDTPTSLGAGIPAAGRVRVGVLGQLRSARFGRPGIDQLEVSEQWLIARGAWSPSDRVMVTLQLPLLRREVSFPNLSRDIAYGPADLELGGRAVVFQDRRFEPGHLIALRVAVELPTGIRRSNIRGESLPIDLQLGSGGIDGRVGIDYALFASPMTVFASVTAQASTAGFRGTVPGPVVLGAVTAQVELIRELAIRLGTQVRWEAPLHYRDESRDPDSGGVVGLASPAVVLRPTAGWFFALGVDIPVVRSLRGVQSVGPTSYLEVVVDV